MKTLRSTLPAIALATMAALATAPAAAADYSLAFQGVTFQVSILDADTASVQLAFAGIVAPNAVPTTLVIDREGRVAARISGIVREQSILSSMIDSVVAEGQ